MLYQIILFIGIILFVISMFTLRKALVLLKKSEKTVGKVREMERVEQVVDNDGITYKPISKLRTNLNEERMYNYPFSSSPPAWTIGDKAIITYNPNNSKSIRVLTYFGTFGLPVTLLAIAMPLLVISIGY